MPDSLIITCPHCLQRNRMPAPRITEASHCGKCKRDLFTGAPVELDPAGLHAHQRADLPLLVDFWAPWCGPCQAFAPTFKQAAQLLEPRVRLAKINTEAYPALGTRLQVRSIPTLILFNGERELSRVSGALPAQQLIQWVEHQLLQQA